MMRLFIKHILIFLIPVLLANLLFIPWVKRNTGAETYLENVVHISSDIDTIILADSHGTVLDDDILKGTHIANLSYGSDSYSDMYQKLLYVSKRQRIKRVIITADRHTLSRHRESSNNNYLSAQLESYNSLGYKLLQVLPLFDSRNVAIFQEYLLSKLGNHIDRLSGQEQEENIPWEKDPERYQRATRRVAYHFPSSEISPLLTDALSDIITYCQEHNIELIGLMYPLTREYYEALEGRDMGAAEILKKAEIPVIQKDTVYIDSPELFINQDHLNSHGGSEFTRLLLGDIASLSVK